MSLKFDKNNLLFYFNTYDFPEKLINKDVLVHKELLFNDKPSEPELLNQRNKKAKYFNYYLTESHEQRKANKQDYNKNKSHNNNNKQQYNQFNQFNQNNQSSQFDNNRRPGEDDVVSGGSDFFDNFSGKGKSANTQVKEQVKDFYNDKKKVEFKTTKENDIFIDISANKSQLYDLLAYARQQAQQIHEKAQEIQANNKFDADKLFENADILNNSQKQVKSSNSNNTSNSNSSNEQQTKSQNKINSTNTSSNQKKTTQNTEMLNTVDISLIYKINDRINYPKEQPLWYIYHTGAKSSFGPLSSTALEEMYIKGLIAGQSEVRFIDLITLKNKKPFDFFKLKDIETNIVSDIEASSLIFYSSGLIKKDDEVRNVKVQENTNNNANNSNTQKVLPSQDSIYNINSNNNANNNSNNVNSNTTTNTSSNKHYNNNNNYNNNSNYNNNYNNNYNYNKNYYNKNNQYYDKNNNYYQGNQEQNYDENYNEGEYYQDKRNAGKGGKHDKWY